jgi:hypothetical protein
MITKTKALVKNSKATRGKGRDGLPMSERLLIGAYTNPQDAACDQSLDVTHDEYCSTEMSSVGPYRRARHVAAGQTRVCGMSDHRLHVKLGLALLHASIGGRSVIFGHWFGNLDAIMESFPPASLSINSFSSSSLQVHTSCPTLSGRMRTHRKVALPIISVV